MLRLLEQLGEVPASRLTGVVLTLNAPALDLALCVDAALADKLNLQVLRNSHPLGFGANHNQAFKAASNHFKLSGKQGSGEGGRKEGGYVALCGHS